MWLDRDDLPPGETDVRLREALDSGISGALLVATPNVGIRKTKDAIHDIEAPLIFETLAKIAGFTLAVLNTEAEAPMKVEREATNRLYGMPDASSLHARVSSRSIQIAVEPSCSNSAFRQRSPCEMQGALGLFVSTRTKTAMTPRRPDQKRDPSTGIGSFANQRTS